MRPRLAMARAIALASTIIAAPNLALADTVNFFGNGGVAATPVSYTGKIDVTTAGGGTSAAIKVTLTNTTTTGSAATYGFITGFGLNIPTLNVTGATGSSTDTDFKFLTPATAATTLQGGSFDYAFSTSATQLHTVASNQIATGLGSNQSSIFTINLTGTGLGGLTALQIIKELSASPGVPLSVRFRSTNTAYYQGGNSPDGDKVPFSYYTTPLPPPPPPPSAVPAPAGLLLGIIGVGCLFGRSMRRKTAEAVVS